MRCGIVALLFLSVANLQGLTDNREAQQIVFMLMLVSLFSLLVRNIWVTLFILWTVFLYSFFKFASGSIYLSNIFLGSVLYYLTKASFKKEHAGFFINGFLWFVFLNIAYCSVQVLGYDFMFSKILYNEGFVSYGKNLTPNGFMGSQAIMATLTAFAVPLLATRGSAWAWAGAAGLLVLLVLFKTSLCFLAGAGGLLFVLYYKLPRKIWIGLVLIAALSGLGYVQKIDKIGTERFVQWQRVLSDWKVHPITGWGLDSFANETPTKDFRYAQTIDDYSYHKEPDGKEYTDIKWIKWWDNPHNLYISLLYEFGLVGLILFAGYMRQNFMRFKVAIKNSNTVGLMGFILVVLGVSAGHFPLFLARTAVLIIPAFAIYENLTEE